MRLRACGWWLVVGFWLGLSGAAGAQTYQAKPETLGAIPDAVGPSDGYKIVYVPVTHQGLLEDLAISLTMNHTFVGDLRVRVAAPEGVWEVTLFAKTGAKSDAGDGDGSNLSGTYVFSNAGTRNWWQTAEASADSEALAPGHYRFSRPGGANWSSLPQTIVWQAANVQGMWTIIITDETGGDVGEVTAASLTLTTSVAAPWTSLGQILDAPACNVPASPREVPFNVSGLAGVLRGVSIEMFLDHPWAGHLTADLTAPNGANHLLFSRTGSSNPIGPGDSSDLYGKYRFTDDTHGNWWESAAQTAADAAIPPGAYRTSQAGSATATSAPTTMDPVFAGQDPNGTWTLRLSDTCNGSFGSILTSTLLLLANLAVDDYYDVPFQVGIGIAGPGILANDITSTGALKVVPALASLPQHGVVGVGADGAFLYFPNAGYVGPDSFSYRASTLGAPSNVATVHLMVAPPAMTSGADGYTTSFETALVVAAPGVLANDTTAAGTLSAVLVTAPAHGTATLAADGSLHYVPAADFAGTDTFTYRPSAFGGLGPLATVTVTVPEPTTAQPPKLFDVVHASGSRILLRWDPPLHGPAPTAFVLSGGVAPGQTLAAIALPANPPVLAIDLPPGVLYLRMATQAASGTSGPSNELRVPVLVAEPPSPPAALTATVDGGALTLTWKDTFLGGAPGTVKQLDVSGAITATVPISAGETITVPGVPPGTYAIAVRGANAAGSSAPSPPVSVTLPAGCTGAPLPPHRFLAYRDGNAVGLLWEPPTTGPAPATYELVVSGAYTGVVPMGMQRRLSAPVPPGAYSIAVRAANACGTGAATAPQVVVVP